MHFQRIILIVSALFGATAILLAAAAAHMPHLADASRALCERAALHQLIHAGMLFAIALHYRPAWRIGAACFAVGIVCFCGGIYLRHFMGVDIPARIVPMGGSLLALGWLALLLGLRSRV